jgi:hypothetical protein
VSIEHLGVYVLSPDDDIKWQHFCKFGTPDRNRKNRVRLGIICRWLGRRHHAFCEDKDGVRQYMESWRNPNKLIAQNRHDEKYIDMYQLDNIEKVGN